MLASICGLFVLSFAFLSGAGLFYLDTYLETKNRKELLKSMSCYGVTFCELLFMMICIFLN